MARLFFRRQFLRRPIKFLRTFSFQSAFLRRSRPFLFMKVVSVTVRGHVRVLIGCCRQMMTLFARFRLFRLLPWSRVRFNGGFDGVTRDE